MRWNAGYESDADGELEHAVVEAPSAADAASRLREVVGTHTDVVFVVPDEASPSPETTYEDFLEDPGTATN